MRSDNIHPGWEKFKRMNNSDEILENEILDIVGRADHRVFYLFKERAIRNVAIFSFLLAFCQNCYV